MLNTRYIKILTVGRRAYGLYVSREMSKAEIKEALAEAVKVVLEKGPFSWERPLPKS